MTGQNDSRKEMLRDVLINGYRLETWDTYRTDRLGKSVLAYRFTGPDGEVIFEGADFCCSPLCAIDSDDCLRALLGFLTLQPGDTDEDYFDAYTDRQLEFAEGDAEYLGLWAHDSTMEFEEVEGEE